MRTPAGRELPAKVTDTVVPFDPLRSVHRPEIALHILREEERLYVNRLDAL
jgi:hypothetical protein